MAQEPPSGNPNSDHTDPPDPGPGRVPLLDRFAGADAAGGRERAARARRNDMLMYRHLVRYDTLDDVLPPGRPR